MKNLVVLAYSGGLDTSVAIKWLQDNYNFEVVALVADVGQLGDLEVIRKRALANGAKEALLVDLKEEFVEGYIAAALRANALYQGKYPVSTALARPLIAQALVAHAHEYGAGAVAHGCTAKGNDQVRFDISVALLDPYLDIIAPAREWKMSREEEIEYALKHGLDIPVTKSSPYSVDENMWGRSVECGPLEDPWNEPGEDVYEWTCSPKECPAEPLYVEVVFERGIPVQLDGASFSRVEIIRRLNQLGGTYGVGRIDMMEDRVVGIKSREIYECPAATVLITAHADLESLVLPKDVLDYKSGVDRLYADLIYSGKWFSPLKEALDGFISITQERGNGTVRLKLECGKCVVVGRKSDCSLYDPALATYGKGDLFSHQSARGFIELYGLPMRSWALKGDEADEEALGQ